MEKTMRYYKPDLVWEARLKLTRMVDEGIFDEVDADTASEIVEQIATSGEFDFDFDRTVQLWEWFDETYDLCD
jgi:hypothetical protein